MQHSVLECVPLFLFAPFHPARSAHLNASNALVRLTKTFCNYRVAHCSWFSQFFSIFGFCAPKNMEKWREREIERGMEREKETPIGQCDRWLFIIIFIFCFVCSEISWNAWRTQWILASLMGGDDDLVGDIMSASIVQKGPTHLLCFSLSIHLLFIQMQFFFFFSICGRLLLVPVAICLISSVTSIVRCINARFVHWHPEKDIVRSSSRCNAINEQIIASNNSKR